MLVNSKYTIFDSCYIPYYNKKLFYDAADVAETLGRLRLWSAVSIYYPFGVPGNYSKYYEYSEYCVDHLQYKVLEAIKESSTHICLHWPLQGCKISYRVSDENLGR